MLGKLRIFEMPSRSRAFLTLDMRGLNLHGRGLNRGLVSTSFSQLFPSCTIHNTSVSHSDHLALIISLYRGPNFNNTKRTKKKHFEPYWLKDDECSIYFNRLWLSDPSPTTDSVISNLGFHYGSPARVEHEKIW